MAISVDWAGTKVIYIPKSFLTLVQATPTEIYELPLNAFRLALLGLQDDTDGRPWQKTYRHNTEVALGGLTYARTFEVLDPYTVTFEDGQYAVNLTGANSNVGDRVNVNQVSVRSQNSAGLISSPAIEYASFDGGVTIDVDNGVSGTVYPKGTKETPVNNLDDAVLIAEYRGFDTLFLSKSMSLGAGIDISDFTIIGKSATNTHITIDPSAVCSKINIEKCNVSGTLDGGTTIHECSVGDLTYVNGHIHNSGLYGTVFLDGNEGAVFVNCYTPDQDSPPIIDMGSSGQDLSMPNYSGIVTIRNLSSASEEIGIGLDAGMVILEDTITAGTVLISGIGLLQDYSTGITDVNSDGLISIETITKTTWNKVYVDTNNGSSGTEFPLGTLVNPTNNIADGILIANTNKIKIIYFNGSETISGGEDLSGLTIIAERSLNNEIIITNAITQETYFENLTVSGVMNGSVRYTTSVLGAISNFDGGAKNCLLTNTIGITGTGANYFTDCDVYITDPNTPIEIDVGSSTLNLIRCRGGYKLTNKTSINTLAIDLVGGIITVTSSCTAGQIFVGGIAEVIDDSAAGCLVLVKSMSHEAISKNVWDEPLTAAKHNEPTSAGKRLRGLTSMVIRNELCQGPGTGNNQIKLDVDASVLDGAYDPAMVTIIGGVGSGQTRQILDYVGSTRMVTVDRNWRVNPDATSEFAIISHAGREHVNEGLARGGTTNTITLNTSASSVTDAYVGQVVFIRSGTGEDQGCRIASYDGTIKVATICHNWPVIPDTTSGYVILPTATITKESLGDAIWENATAVTFLNDMAFVKDIEGGKWELIDNQMIFYKEDNVTEIARFDLFDKDGVPSEQDVYERRVV